jgi:hypothetical protein
MYDDLVERFGEERIDAVLDAALRDRLAQLYDNRERLRADTDGDGTGSQEATGFEPASPRERER